MSNIGLQTVAPKMQFFAQLPVIATAGGAFFGSHFLCRFFAQITYVPKNVSLLFSLIWLKVVRTGFMSVSLKIEKGSKKRKTREKNH